MVDVVREILYIDHLKVHLLLVLSIQPEWYPSLQLYLVFGDLEHLGLLYCQLDEAELLYSICYVATSKDSFNTVEVQKQGELQLGSTFKLLLQKSILRQVRVSKVKLELIAQFLNYSFLIILDDDTAHLSIFPMRLNAEYLPTSTVPYQVRVRFHLCAELPLLVLVISLLPLDYLYGCGILAHLLWGSGALPGGRCPAL